MARRKCALNVCMNGLNSSLSSKFNSPAYIGYISYFLIFISNFHIAFTFLCHLKIERKRYIRKFNKYYQQWG